MSVKPNKNLSVDMLRAISAVAIVFLHSTLYALFYFYQTKGTEREFLYNMPEYLAFSFSFNKAVDIFFALSAYLLGTQLFNEINKTGRICFPNYYIRRFFRIYPLFFIALALYSLQYIGGFPTVDEFLKIFHNLIFIDNFTKDTIIPVGWSLSIEVQFYIFLPFLILFCYKSRKHTWIIVFVALLVISLLARYLILANNPSYYHENLIYALLFSESSDFIHDMYYSTYARFGTLIVGLLWAYLYQKPKALAFLRRLPPLTAMLLFVITFLIMIFSLLFPFDIFRPMDTYSTYPTLQLWGLVFHRVVFVASVITLVVLIDLASLLTRTRERLKKMRVHSLLGFFSNLSYPIYLFHFPFIPICYIIVLGTTDVDAIEKISMAEALVAFILTLFLVSLFSAVLHKFIEKPFINKGRDIALKRKLRSNQQ